MSRYVVKCSCGAITGCLPPNTKPQPESYIMPVQLRTFGKEEDKDKWRKMIAEQHKVLSMDEIRRGKLCCQCSKQLDDTKGYFISRPEAPINVPENLLSVAGASNAIS